MFDWLFGNKRADDRTDRILEGLRQQTMWSAEIPFIPEVMRVRQENKQLRTALAETTALLREAREWGAPNIGTSTRLRIQECINANKLLLQPTPPDSSER